jgi:hypothetical protein
MARSFIEVMRIIMSSNRLAFNSGFARLAVSALIACSALAHSLAAQQPAIDPLLADQYFQEARAMCSKDGGNLWGISIDGPLIFADPRTRSIVANRGDGEGRLVAKGNVFVGRLPETQNIANTAVRWAGVEWTMVMWPLPENKQSRARLMAHELFHRIQDELGLPALNPSNDHLDTLDGRIMLRLEWRALKVAIMSRGEERRRSIEDALVFRARRRELFQTAAETERGLEMNEGLAEYTGVRLCGKTAPETSDYLRAKLEAAEKMPSFARSFAYTSGPAYGFLLDEAGTVWRNKLSPRDDFGVLLRKALSITPPADLKQQAEKRAARYEGGLVRAEETAREESRNLRAAEHRRRLVEGPVLILPLTDEVRYSFDPYNVETLEGHGTVYPSVRIVDAWGILDVSGGALMIREGQRVVGVRVSAPRDLSARPLVGEGWKLTLNGGWRLVPSARAGDYTLKKES